MAYIIKKARKQKPTFKIGDIIRWNAKYETHYGEVTKVHPVNLYVEDNDGNIWSVGKKEVTRLLGSQNI